MSLRFKPTHKYNELFNFAKFYGNIGSNKFDGSYTEQRYYEFLKIAEQYNVSKLDWPYYEIENDFYVYNSMGYRTYEFSELGDEEFDIAIGCSFTEGVGVRSSELWVHHLEKKLNTKIVNLGKGGASTKYVNYTLFAWVMSNMKLPKRIFILWTEPTRKTFIRTGGAPIHLNYGWRIRNHLDDTDAIIDQMFDLRLKSSTLWSNEFVEDYCSVNLLFKSLNIKVYNFLVDSMWEYDEHDFNHYTGIVPHNINFNKDVHCWFKNNKTWIYPAYDGIHLAEPHQISIANQMYMVINNEEN